MKFEFPDEDLMSICQTNEEESKKDNNCKMFLDEALNDLGHDIGAVLISLKRDHYPITSKLSFYCTNNLAEYKAYVMGFQAVIEKKIRKLRAYMDFTLVIYQL